MAIWAKIENGTLACRDDSLDGFNQQRAVDDGFTVHNVPDAGWLQIQAGSIVEVDPSEAQIADAKAKKNDEINASRLSANYSTFAYGGKLIACDALSRSDIDGVNGYIALNNALPPNFPGAWKATDNTYVTIADVATWKAFYAAMVAVGTTNFLHAQTLKTAIDTIIGDSVTYPTKADKIAAIEAITW